jgi:putative endonuclease
MALLEKEWYVYILECKDGTYYTGVTTNLEKRMKTHASGKGSKYVYKRGFNRLLKSKLCKDKSEACKFEYQIKQLPRKNKLDWFDV